MIDRVGRDRTFTEAEETAGHGRKPPISIPNWELPTGRLRGQSRCPRARRYLSEFRSELSVRNPPRHVV
jgi:hypothetical protein